ncbi:hypothetical protein C8R43DRAFT_942417 [Mycena crocata]|nr:hypothetical protein C8R43DRAFT_942417 [Mycena crocata]
MSRTGAKGCSTISNCVRFHDEEAAADLVFIRNDSDGGIKHPEVITGDTQCRPVSLRILEWFSDRYYVGTVGGVTANRFRLLLIWAKIIRKREAALMEGLYQHRIFYGPYEVARRHKRSANRNVFISRVILDMTNQIRTPKQVGSRLQQLRGTTRDDRVLRILNRGIIHEEELKALLVTRPSTATAVNGMAKNGEVLRVSLVVALQSARYPSLPPEIILEPSVQSIQLRTLAEFQPQTRLFWQMDPSVVLLSPIPLVLHSIFEVFMNRKPYWVSPTLLVPDGFQNGQRRYSTSIAMDLWSIVSALPRCSGDRIEWTILHTIFRLDSGGGRQRAPFAELSYKFEPPHTVPKANCNAAGRVLSSLHGWNGDGSSEGHGITSESDSKFLANVPVCSSREKYNDFPVPMPDGFSICLPQDDAAEYSIRHDLKKPMGAFDNSKRRGKKEGTSQFKNTNDLEDGRFFEPDGETNQPVDQASWAETRVHVTRGWGSLRNGRFWLHWPLVKTTRCAPQKNSNMSNTKFKPAMVKSDDEKRYGRKKNADTPR